ncbi:hypothetical protein SMU36_05540 [Streptococcus mutans 4VF1]|nr:hypothetical protein SMU36_05540 [Streptococcus mutans 4VF1]
MANFILELSVEKKISKEDFFFNLNHAQCVIFLYNRKSNLKRK